MNKFIKNELFNSAHLSEKKGKKVKEHFSDNSGHWSSRSRLSSTSSIYDENTKRIAVGLILKYVEIIVS